MYIAAFCFGNADINNGINTLSYVALKCNTCKTVVLEYMYLLHVPCNIFNNDNDLHGLHNCYGMYLYCIKSAVADARASDFSKSSSSRSITS